MTSINWDRVRGYGKNIDPMATGKASHIRNKAMTTAKHNGYNVCAYSSTSAREVWDLVQWAQEALETKPKRTSEETSLLYTANTLLGLE